MPGEGHLSNVDGGVEGLADIHAQVRAQEVEVPCRTAPELVGVDRCQYSKKKLGQGHYRFLPVQQGGEIQ